MIIRKILQKLHNRKNTHRALTYDGLLDKTILVGMTYNSADGEVVELKQLWGTVVRADDTNIEIQNSNGDIFDLPPDLSAIRKAAPGEYRLRSTGEIVTDPDYLATYIVTMKGE